MKRRKRNTSHVNHERWLVSYADFITLLFAVFVVMYAAAHVDNKKIGELSHAIHDAFKDLGVFQSPTSKRPAEDVLAVALNKKLGAPASDNLGRDNNDLRRMLESALAPDIQKKQARLRESPDGLVISLQEIGFYDQGSDVLKEASTETLNRVANALKPIHRRIRIEGHTDNVPIHNARFASNWELSAARATGLVRIFIEHYGFNPAQLAAAGYAEYHPIQSNDSIAGRSTNRRVDIVVLDEPKKILTPPSSLEPNPLKTMIDSKGEAPSRAAVPQPSSNP